jgi:hypothetical protein
MRTCLLKTKFFLLMLAIANISHAQKDIVISDSLAVNSEKLKVKMGSQGFGKIWKFQFGDYAVISSKAGWTTTSTKGNFFNTKTESKSTKKFSFLMADKLNDTASVNAANNIATQSLQELQIFSNVFWGNNELLHESQNFSAYITINGDTSKVWALLINIIRGSNAQGTYDALLTNGERNIVVIPASSNKNGSDSRSMPALGYEFIENGQSLSALQYYGGGIMGMNKNIVWLHNGLDEKIKLILAAASTAILQMKMDSYQEKM